MLLRPGSPRWTRTLIPFKKEPKPAEQLALALSPVLELVKLLSKSIGVV